MFGEAALVAALEQSAGVEADEAADHIVASVQRWAPSQDDDLTLLVCDYAG
jgi:sigma-B regulation protein RsbU (phosphoserine phosphatase)